MNASTILMIAATKAWLSKREAEGDVRDRLVHSAHHLELKTQTYHFPMPQRPASLCSNGVVTQRRNEWELLAKYGPTRGSRSGRATTERQ